MPKIDCDFFERVVTRSRTVPPIVFAHILGITPAACYVKSHAYPIFCVFVHVFRSTIDRYGSVYISQMVLFPREISRQKNSGKLVWK